MTDIQFDAGKLKQAADELRAAQEAFLRDTEQLLAQVSDPSVFGTNDTVGSIASMIYQSVIERVKETVESLRDAGEGHQQGLSEAARAYADTESEATNLAHGMAQGMEQPWQ